MFKDLSNFRFRDFNQIFFSTIAGWVLIVILIIGVIKYFNSDDRSINRYLEFGLIYSCLTTLFYFPVMFYGLFIDQGPYGTDPTILRYFISLSYVIMSVFVFIYFGKQIKTFQRPPFGRREKSYGPTPYGQYLISDQISVSRVLRFKNYILDIIFVLLIVFPAITQWMITFLGIEHRDLNSILAFRLILILSLLLYYIAAESLTGKTLGKIITGSTVQFYGKSTFAGALGRTFCRMIPFEPISFFFKKGYGWHDEFSGTTVEKLEDITTFEEDISQHLVD